MFFDPRLKQWDCQIIPFSVDNHIEPLFLYGTDLQNWHTEIRQQYRKVGENLKIVYHNCVF